MLQRRRPAMSDATTGQLIEHSESTFQFQTLFDGLGLLVCDKGDRLVEMEVHVAELLRCLNPHHTRRTCVTQLACQRRCWTSWVRCATDTEIFSPRAEEVGTLRAVWNNVSLRLRHSWYGQWFSPPGSEPLDPRHTLQSFFRKDSKCP